MRPDQVGQFMIAPVPCLDERAPLREAAAALADSGASALFVRTQRGYRLFSEYDLAAALASGADLARPAAAWAKTPWLVIPEDTLAADAVREMLRRHAHWLVVADREGQPVGLVTMRTLLREMDLGDFFQTQRMRDVMSTAPLTMPPEASLLDAAQAMHARRISCVLVGTAPRPEGIFTLSDLAKASAEGVDLARTPLAARMSAPLVQVGAEQSLLEAVAAMVAHGVRRAAVAGDDGAIVGIVTLTDVIQALGVEASGEAPMQALRAIAEAAGAEHLRVFSEEELAAIMDALPVGVVRLRWDPGAPLPAALADAPWAGEAQGTFVVDYASPNLRRILGHAPEAMKEEGFWFAHLHPEDLETFKMRAAELWAHGAFSHRYRFRHADGRWIWVDEWVRLVRDEEGRPREMIVALADATRRVEEERRASERDEFLKSLVMVAPFAIGVLDAEGKLVFGNPAGVRMFAAKSFAELEGLDPAEVLHPDDRARAKRRIADFLAGRPIPQPAVYRFFRKNGEMFYGEVWHARIERRNQPAMLFITLDVSEREARRRLDQALAEVLARAADPSEPLAPLLEACARALEQERPHWRVGVMLLEGRRLRHAAAGSLPAFYTAAIDGIEIGPEIGTCGRAAHFGRRMITEDIERDPYWAPARELARQAGLRACFSEPIRAASGEILGVLSCYAERPGRPSALDLELMRQTASVAASVITHKRAQQRIAGHEQMLSAIFATIPDAVLVYTPEAIRAANPAAAHAFGAPSPEELAGRAPLEFVHPDDRERARQRIARVWLGEDEAETETLRFLRGDEVWEGEVNCTTLTFDGERHMLAVIRDVSERERLQRQLAQAMKLEAVGRLAGGVAHDFNNMLAGMMGNLFLLRRRLGKQPELLVRIGAIERQAQRAADLVQQLLTFARKRKLDKRPVRLDDLVRDTLKLQRVILPENVRLEVDVPEQPLWVVGDATMLQQVLINLLTNARDAVADRPDARIEVRLRSEAEAVCARCHRHGACARHGVILEVADNGPGIPEAHLSKIFEPFFTTKEVGKGTGLGLAMVHGTVQEHGGEVWVESRAGEGARFFVCLPLMPARDDESAPDAGQAPEGEGETILLAEDEESVRTSLKEALQEIGYAVDAVEDGRKAWERFRAQPERYALAVLDVVMPEMGGVEAMRRMRELRPDLPVIFHTGYGESAQAVAEYEGSERTRCLRKPVRIEDLAAAIAEMLDRPTG